MGFLISSTTILPEWSPSGEWIAFQNAGGVLGLISPDGKQVRTLGGRGPAAWSLDGRTLYQVRDAEHSLVAIDIATGQARRIRDLGDALPYATWNPGRRLSLTGDGRDVVYTVNRSREEIWILDGFRSPRPWWTRFWR